MPLGGSAEQQSLADAWVAIMRADHAANGRFTLLPSEAARMVASSVPGTAAVDVLVALGARAGVKAPLGACDLLPRRQARP